MNVGIYKATFRKSSDGLAINSFKVTAEALPRELATETKKLLKGDIAPDGFVIQVMPFVIQVMPDEC